MVSNIRAESIYHADALPICERARCRPEREYHAEVMVEVHRRYSPHLNRLRQKGRSA